MEKEKREMSSRIGSFIRHRREELKYSLNDLGKITGISNSYINRLERNERKACSLPIIYNLAEGLNVSVWDILDVAIPIDRPPISLSNLILKSDCLVNDKKASIALKELIVELNDEVLRVNWDESNRFQAGAVILDLVSMIKSIIEKEVA